MQAVRALLTAPDVNFLTWRDGDLDQRNVENARTLWLRFVEKNRRDVEEKSEQLKAILNLSALFAGFATVTLTQFNLAPPPANPLGLIIMYGVLTAIVEGCMAVSLVTCALVLGSILKSGRKYVGEAAEEEFMFRCHQFCETFRAGDRPPAPKRTFESFWDLRCEGAWTLAFYCFNWGVSAFLLSMVPVGWIIFSRAKLTASLFVSICLLALLGWGYVQFVWGLYMRKRPSADHQGDPWGGSMGLPFDWHNAPMMQD
eukprot:SM000096S24873  [mRNA]  locus=s96:211191:213321:- [translate_table: standard]